MALPYFTFKNIDSSNYLIVNKLPPIFKAAKDIELIEVQGKDGFLTNDLGSYRSVIKTVECTIRDLSNIDYICGWLSGGGEVVFSNEPTKIYKATIKNQIQFSKVIREFYSFIIQFECQPHKYNVSNDMITLTTSPIAVNNSGLSNTKPIIKIYGTGSINLTINSKVVRLTNVVGYITIDSDIMDAYKDTTNMNNDMSGEFPELVPGSNIIAWTGTVTKVEITPNWRNL